jgi:hypothetical protein
MDSSRDGVGCVPLFSLRGAPGQVVTLERFRGQPIVLALSSGAGELPEEARNDGALEAVRAELRGLGAVLLLISDDGVLAFGPEDEICRVGRGDARDAAGRGEVRARYGVPPGATGLFVIDGDLRLRFSHVAAASEGGALPTIAAALAAAGHIDVHRFTLSRRELVVSSLAAGFALALLQAPVRAAPVVPITPVGAGEQDVTLTINGVPRHLRIDARVTLLDALRERLGLMGTKKGCDQGQCGACTVLVDGRRVNACLTLAMTAEGLRRGTGAYR